MKHGCYWILEDLTHCDKPVRYRMVDDGGEPGAAKVRKYDAFCAEHQALADESDDDD